MKKLFVVFLLLCSNAFASVVDGRFDLTQVFAMPGGGPFQGWDYWRSDPGWFGVNSAACALSVSNCNRLTTGALENPRDASNINLGFAPYVTSLNAGEYIAFFNNGNGYSYGRFDASGNLLNDLGPVSFIKISQSYIVFRVDNWYESIVFTDTTHSVGDNLILNVPLGSGMSPSSWNPVLPNSVTIGAGTPGTLSFGSAAPITTDQQTKLDTWSNRVAPNGNTIYIQQVGGDNNTVIMNQDGNQNLIRLQLQGTNNNITARQGVQGIGQNEMKLSVEGNNNVLNLNQSRDTQGNAVGVNGHYLAVDIAGWGTNLTVQQTNTGGVGGHYNETTISGNGNNVLEKQTDNGNKIMFVNVNGALNSVDVQQRGTGQHRADVSLTGDRNSATVLQEGSTANNATLNLTNAGGPATVNVQQNGGQSVGLTTTCSTTGGCAPITVRQGY